MLATASGENGDKNVIEEIKVNGVKVNPENKVVNLTIPSIEGLAVASEVESTYAKKNEIPSTTGFAQVQYVDDQLTNYVKLVDLKDGIQFNTLEANSLKIDGKNVSLEGHGHSTSDITNLTDVVAAKFHTHNTSDINGIGTAATNAIQAIDDSENISELKIALKNFIQAFSAQ